MSDTEPARELATTASDEGPPRDRPSPDSWRAPTQNPRDEPEPQELPGDDSHRGPGDPIEIDEPPDEDDQSPEKRLRSRLLSVDRAPMRTLGSGLGLEAPTPW